jgi:S-DNA-T family DNA segregation ATPase FtsK/SpoIIIE
VAGIVLLAITALSTLSVASFTRPGGNLVGALGDAVGGALIHAFGLGAWIVAVDLTIITARLFLQKKPALGLAHLSVVVTLLSVGCALVHLAAPELRVYGDMLPGGALGEVFGELLRSVLGLAGAVVIGVAVLLTMLVLRTGISVLTLTQRGAGVMKVHSGTGVSLIRDAIVQVAEAFREGREERPVKRPPKPRSRKAPVVADSDEEDDDLDDDEEDGEELEDEDDDEVDEDLLFEDEHEVDDDELEDDDPTEPTGPAQQVVAQKPALVAKGVPRPVRTPAEGGPTIVAPSPDAQMRPVTEEQPRTVQGTTRPYELPATSLLDPIVASEVHIDASQLKQNATRLVEKLAAYGVTGRVDEIHPGPVVTMYEFEPKSGTKVSKIAGLADDLAMSLAAQKVRIVAPIPGKARVGFELPNAVRQTVSLRQIIEDERWTKQTGPLPIALGKDIAGQPYYGDLSKMPHVLVAGATGAGKSVGLNVMLASLLFKRTPEEVRLLMIDPKMVELAVYDGIPHMLLPVVTDMKKASLALRWAVDEMERRYQLFADAGARNVTTYNQRVEKVLSGEMTAEKLWPSKAGRVRGFGQNGEEVWHLPDGDEEPDPLPTPEKLPYVVLVVDEFADLMMVAAKDVESAIARLAQKARAAGIHVILATQRPSVDVITGMIKANFPARIAFKVSQREDSKTILGRQGAEHLLGMGDMLMIPPGSSDLKRVHSAYISEDEVTSLCDFLRTQGKPIYDESILRPRDEDDEGGGGPVTPRSDDPMYDKAVATVAQAGYCSISHLQRQLGLGYNKAAKLVERMEKDGVVGPASGKAGGRRDVLIQAF